MKSNIHHERDSMFERIYEAEFPDLKLFRKHQAIFPVLLAKVVENVTGIKQWHMFGSQPNVCY